ncbi:hypothetical protein PRZ48_007585 [Zasmidium cellare]|uniref:Uncharacterized protein n=1 Tax=Zasmidium cellare TaxID=395010 RepID=A0ABR0EKG9_ZASCE|nr:hypothetical protein PRZ48_007585 [Zasmidium cellare]
MLLSKNIFTPVVCSLLLTANPTEARLGIGKILREIIKAVGGKADAIVQGETPAWDFNAIPAMCKVDMTTTDGGNYYASVSCLNGYSVRYEDWNVCYLNGRQFFTDPQIGKFSIEFTGKDTLGEGLPSPILTVYGFLNDLPIDVEDLSRVSRFYEDGSGNGSEFCGFKPEDAPECRDPTPICTFSAGYPEGNRWKAYSCGIPERGLQVEEMGEMEQDYRQTYYGRKRGVGWVA